MSTMMIVVGEMSLSEQIEAIQYGGMRFTRSAASVAVSRLVSIEV
jgi:hypothetical protein